MPRKLKSSTEAPLAPIPAEILDQFVRQGPMTRARGAHVENRDEPVRDPLRGPLHGAERVECLRPKNAWTLPSLWTHRTRPQGTWKTAENAVSHSAHTHRCHLGRKIGKTPHTRNS